MTTDAAMRVPREHSNLAEGATEQEIATAFRISTGTAHNVIMRAVRSLWRQQVRYVRTNKAKRRGRA